MIDPLINLGNAVTGVGGDSTRAAFSKLNAHEHIQTADNFLIYNIAVGDVITLTNPFVKDLVFPVNTVITEIYPNKLVLSQPANLTVERPEAFVTVNDKRIFSVKSTAGSPELEVLSATGNSKIHEFVISGKISNPFFGELHPILLSANREFYIHSMAFKTNTAQCDVTIYVQTATSIPSFIYPIPTSPNLITSKENFHPIRANFNPKVPIDSDVIIQVSGITSQLDLFWTMQGIYCDG